MRRVSPRHVKMNAILYNPAFLKAVKKFAEDELDAPNLYFALQLEVFAWCAGELERLRGDRERGETRDVCC